MLSIQNLGISFGGPALFSGIHFDVLEGERLGLVGRNGAGKSTLLKIISGQEKADEGTITLQKPKRMEMLPQEVPNNMTGVIEDLLKAAYSKGEAAFWEMERDLDQVARQLDLPLAGRFEEQSTGIKRRVLLGIALLRKPDLLILDEPTNHLDIVSVQDLETFLTKSFRGALLFVTHDRRFLQNVATGILDLDFGTCTRWDFNYQGYLEKKADWLAAREKEQALFDRKLAQEEVWIRKGIQARRTRNEGRVRALKEMRRQRRERREAQGSVTIQIDEGNRSGDKVVEAIDVDFSWPGERPVIENFSQVITRQDRIGLVGPNGCGKSTLLQVLLGQLSPQKGMVKVGTQLELAYFDQNREQLEAERTVWQAVADGAETVPLGGKPRHVMTYLQDFLFPPDRARSPVGVLSGGEKNRLLLARLFAQPANVLVLDEPTNDLDLETLELLEEALTEFKGTVLIASHDRAFLDEIVTHLIVNEGRGKWRVFAGGFSDYLEAFPDSPLARGSKVGSKTQAKAESKGKRGKPEKPRKFLNRERAELEAIPAQIEALEEEMAGLVESLGNPELYQDKPQEVESLQSRVQVIESKLEEKFQRWESLEALRRELEG